MLAKTLAGQTRYQTTAVHSGDLFVRKQVERFACQLVICLPPG